MKLSIGALGERRSRKIYKQIKVVKTLAGTVLDFLLDELLDESLDVIERSELKSISIREVAS